MLHWYSWRVQRKAISEAKGILFVLVLLVIASLIWLKPLAVLWIGCILFTFYFFRDPDREAPDDPDLAVAPADGQVVAIEERLEGEVTMQRMICISIFLSIFDVHVNRSPIAGTITHSEATKGAYRDARDPESSKVNASRLWVIENDRCKLVVRQITGAIARRIVAWSKVGDQVAQGEKFGMIRFGSRTELYVPEGSKILVRVGRSVRGGVTPIAQLAPKPGADDEPVL